MDIPRREMMKSTRKSNPVPAAITKTMIPADLKLFVNLGGAMRLRNATHAVNA